MDYVEDHSKLVVGDMIVAITNQFIDTRENNTVIYAKVRIVEDDDQDMTILHLIERNDSLYDSVQQDSNSNNCWDVEDRDCIYKLTDDEITRYVLPEII